MKLSPLQMKGYLLIMLAGFCLLSCREPKLKGVTLLDAEKFTTVVDEKKVSLYTLESGNGIFLQVTNFGGRVVTLWTPDRNGNYEDIVLGYETIGRYLENKGERFLGPVVGRYANRIADGRFTLDGKNYQLPLNNNGQTLHGGHKGLDMIIWDVDMICKNEIVFSCISPDGDEGFPGSLRLKMSYMLTPENEFKISYSATTDKPTVINLSHHGLFNLKGEGNGTITDHLLTIYADYITPVNEKLIPTGEFMEVQGTPFDFRTPTAIGDRINQEDIQLKNGAGYDHNWVISKENSTEIRHVATLYEPHNGRLMEVWSDQPGLQFYSGNFFKGEIMGKYGRTLNFREGLALETQKFPDSPNQPGFPSSRLNPEETYQQTCIYKFSVK
jgi:aldose 1-epimerase